MKTLRNLWSHLEYAPLSVQALLKGGPGEFPASLQLLVPIPTLWSEISASPRSSSISGSLRCTMKPLGLCVCACACNIIFLCISKFHVCNLPGCVLVLAHAAGVSLLRSDTVEGVVSLTSSPGEHLERCCDPLIRVLLDSGSQQVTDIEVAYISKIRMGLEIFTISCYCLTHIHNRNLDE